MESVPNALADIVIFTVNDHETTCVSAAFVSNQPAKPINGRSYYDLGLIGGARVLHAITQMGDQATSAAARAAIEALQPKLLLCVGVAWGAKPDKWQIGDVLLATRLHDWAHRKESAKEGVIPRGFTIPPNDSLLQMIRTAFLDWPGVLGVTKPKLHDGLLLSAPILYDDEDERNVALRTHPEAIGGEMEGRGLVWEASQAKLDWLVIKAVCDWGAGKNAPGVDKDAAQKLAATNSAAFVYYLIKTQLGPSLVAAIDRRITVGAHANPGSGLHDGNEPRDSSHVPTSDFTHAQVSQAHHTQSPLRGWTEITADFLARSRREFDRDGLRHFFDGQEPNWSHALATESAIPRRDVVERTVALLTKPRDATMALLVAAGGEGKSLALRQAAADLATRGCGVLWREDDGSIDGEAVFQLDGSRTWILCSDDGDMIAADLGAILKRLRTEGRTNIHWLIGARDTDWRARFHGRGEPGWSLWTNVWPKVDEHSRRSALGLTRKDATKVVSAWEAVGSLGKLQSVRKAERADILYGAARRSEGEVSGTFFGAVLEERFDAAGLRAHLESMLMRLGEEDGRMLKGSKLRSAFLYAAAAEGVGIDGVDLRVVAELVGVDPKRRRPEILHRLGQEALAAGGGDSLRTRAPAIARAAIQLIEIGRIDEDLIELYRDLVRVTAEFGRNSERTASHGEILHSGPRIYSGLKTLGIDPDRAAAIALAAAEEAVRVDPDLLVRVVTLADTNREAGDPEKASQILRGALASPNTFSDWRKCARGAVFQLGVCEGNVPHLLAGLWLTGMSLSDTETLGPVSDKRAKQSLAGLGAACLEMEKSTPLNRSFLQLLRATAVLGPRVTPAGDAKAISHFLRYEAAADRLKVPSCTAEDAVSHLEAAVRLAGEKLTDSTLRVLVQSLAGVAPPTFETARRTLGLPRSH